jgi:1,5-rhamnosyltransferase
MTMQPEKPRVFFLGWDAEINRIMTASLAESHAAQSLRISKRLKKLSHFMKRWPGGNRWLADFFLKNLGETHADLLIVTGHDALRRLSPFVIERFRGKKVWVMRDMADIGKQEDLARLRHLFDRLYSFDPERCSRFHLDFLPQFMPLGQTDLIRLRARVDPPSAHTPCLYVGAAKQQRYAILSAMAERLQALGCELDFSIVDVEGAKAGRPWCVASHTPYVDYIERALRSKVIVEVNPPGQAGITLRTLEAAFLNRKLLTNNPFVRHLDFYDANNIFIFGEDDPRMLDRFLRGDVVPVGMDRLLPHAPEAMLEKIMADHGL